jgi:hypothetical protein
MRIAHIIFVEALIISRFHYYHVHMDHMMQLNSLYLNGKYY